MYKNLGFAFRETCNKSQNGITFIKGKNDEKFVSYKELYQIALIYLGYFQSKGLKPHDELVLQIEDVESYIYVFWACILGGIVPVPLGIAMNEEQKAKVYNVFDLLENPTMITSRAIADKSNLFTVDKNIVQDKALMMKKRTVFLEDFSDADSMKGKEYEASESELAFILFSSGSTGDPKGVMTTHQAIISGVDNFKHHMCLDKDKDSFLGWMPLTHVAGLTAFHIVPLTVGTNQYFINTPLFLSDPNIWFDKTSEHKATILVSPNFGFRLLMDRLNMDNAKRWDLSCIRLLLTGAEPVNYDVANEFLNIMGKYGLGRNTMTPGYGLSESTSFISLSMNKLENVYFDRNVLSIGDKVCEVGKDDDNAVCYVSNGEISSTFEARICDNDDNDLGVERVGRIQARSIGNCAGYYKNIEATRKIMKPDGWMDTGDLGVLMNGKLFITGRAKDIIFVNGKNFYPTDIEKVAEDIEGIKEGMLAVCGVPDKVLQKEVIIAFVLFKNKLDDFVVIADNLKKHINICMGLDIQEVVPVSAFPLTRSGKVQRYKLGEMYQKGMFDTIINEINNMLNVKEKSKTILAPKNQIEEKILCIWKEVLRKDDISTDESFFTMGGNSIKAVQAVTRLSMDFEIDLNDIFQYQTISKLAQKITYKEGNLKSKLDSYKKLFEESIREGVIVNKDIKKQYIEYKRKVDNSIDSIEFSNRIEYKNILLTGATGYLGSYIFRDLLLFTKSDIYLLVRGKTLEQARNRLLEKNKFYFDTNLLEKYSDRVHIIQGDLQEDKFGLSSSKYLDLSNKIDCIFNVAANVKHYGEYEDFYKINVLGTKRLSDFALLNNPKDFNHVSTIGVASGRIKNKKSMLFTEYDSDVGQEFNNHYTSTKLESEKIVLDMRNRGIKVNIYRVGNIVFDSKSGKFQENIHDNAFYTMLKSLSKIGTFPSLNTNNIDFSFVDSVSQAIIVLFDKKNLKNRTFHITNPYHTSISKVARLFSKYGMNIKTKSVNEFIDILLKYYENEEMKQHIEALLVHSNTMFSSGGTKYLFTNKKTEMILRKLGFKWPRFNDELSRNMLNYCREVSFL